MKVYRFFILFFVLFCVCVLLGTLSCSTESSLQQILGTNAEAPVFLDCHPVSPKELAFSFNKEVRVVSLNFNPSFRAEPVKEGSEVLVAFLDPLDEGIKVTADILVEDEKGNTLNVIVPFRSRNDRMPALAINEIRTEYSKPKVEFVEFLAIESGNLGAMKLFIASYSPSKPVYEWNPAEVKKGEYMVLHLRTVEEGCLDETGANLALSSGTDAQDSARDFWLSGTVKVLRKTDALWLEDQDGRIIDAVLLGETADSIAGNAKVLEAAEFLAGKQAWSGSAFFTAGTTNTRTICRDETVPAGAKAGNWYITATSSATPGKPNNPKRYTPN